MEDALERRELDLLGAIRRGDRDAVAAMLADDFVITTAGWISEPVGKAAWLEGLADHTLHSFELRVLAYRRCAGASVVVVESRQRGVHAGEPWDHLFRYTDVWVGAAGDLMLAVRHASIVRRAR
jgi:ketosteroid isomerase-like protein